MLIKRKSTEFVSEITFAGEIIFREFLTYANTSQ